MLSLVTTEVLVISRCPLLTCEKKSQLSLGMLSPKTAAALLWGSACSLLLWLTETRPLTFVWTLSTRNQLVLVFDISWESHQQALVVLFLFPFFKISVTFSALLPHSLPGLVPCAPSRDHTVPSCRNIPDVSHLGQSELGSISIKLEKKALEQAFFSPNQLCFHASKCVHVQFIKSNP